jgi:hypothetical protein
MPDQKRFVIIIEPTPLNGNSSLPVTDISQQLHEFLFRSCQIKKKIL